MIYRFDVAFRSDGACRFTCNGHRHADMHGLARAIVEADAPDGRVEGGRPGKRDWTAPSLHALAAGTLSEGEKGFTRGIYQPYPPRAMHPALEHAVSRATVARKNRVGAGGR